MFKSGDKVVVSVSEGSVLMDFNKEKGEVVDVVKDLLNHKLYSVDVNGNNILAFEFELKMDKDIVGKKRKKGEKKCE